MMEAVRSLGLAARFVSGYIFVPGLAKAEPARAGRRRDARMDAGLSAGRGWVDFDPTNSIIGNRNLIRVAVAWDPKQVLPLWGTLTARLRISGHGCHRQRDRDFHGTRLRVMLREF